MPKITISFKKDGTSTIRTEGFKGHACMDATKEIEKALGNVESEKKTEEYYQPNIDLERILNIEGEEEGKEEEEETEE